MNKVEVIFEHLSKTNQFLVIMETELDAWAPYINHIQISTKLQPIFPVKMSIYNFHIRQYTVYETIP